MRKKHSILINDSSSGTEPEGGTERQLVVRPQSLIRPVSPPLPNRRSRYHTKSATAAVEAGEKHVEDHLSFYLEQLSAAIRSHGAGELRLSIREWADLYKRSVGSERGSHFVIHQHDHPVAGTHYDLRLQCNTTSSISFAIMYGLPGDPNSLRLNRNATETRVHCLWNHLVETASDSTGSMLLWDTGEYEVLPYHVETTDVQSDGSDYSSSNFGYKHESEQQKLHRAFNQRKIRLRLHGTRLPPGYTLSLRLTKQNYRDQQPGKPSRRRRRKIPQGKQVYVNSESEETGTESDPTSHLQQKYSSKRKKVSPPAQTQSKGSSTGEQDMQHVLVASDEEDETIRQNNAYPGALNNIGSVHQRRWYLSLDRSGSGFVKRVSSNKSGISQTLWVPKGVDCITHKHPKSDPGGFTRFHVLGRDSERSVLTGRLANDILEDEGVRSFMPRGLWRPVTE